MKTTDHKNLQEKVHNNSKKDLNQAFENQLASSMESVAKAILLFVLLYFILLVPSLPVINVYMAENGIIFDYNEYYWMIVGAFFSLLLYKFSTKVLIFKLRHILSSKNTRTDETEAQRLTRLGNLIYGVLYYSLAFCSLLALTFGTEFCPVIFGGRLNTKDGILAWPIDVNWKIRIFYMLTLGHHLERTLYETTVNLKSKTFFVMVLHHVLTIGLVFLSFFMRHLIFGIPVMLIHDFNDIFLNSSRFFRETKFQNLTSVLVVMLMLSWFYSRIYSFSFEVIYGVFYQLVKGGEFTTKFLFAHLFFPPALLLLYILNVYWGFQITKIIFIRLWKGKDELPFEDAKKKSK